MDYTRCPKCGGEVEYGEMRIYLGELMCCYCVTRAIASASAYHAVSHGGPIPEAQ